METNNERLMTESTHNKIVAQIKQECEDRILTIKTQCEQRIKNVVQPVQQKAIAIRILRNLKQAMESDKVVEGVKKEIEFLERHLN